MPSGRSDGMRPRTIAVSAGILIIGLPLLLLALAPPPPRSVGVIEGESERCSNTLVIERRTYDHTSYSSDW